MKEKHYGLHDAGFTSEYLSEEPTRIGQKTACRCPRCSDSRKKSAEKCAQVTRVADGWVWYCNHCYAGTGEFITAKTKDEERRDWELNNPKTTQNFMQQQKPVQVLPPTVAKVRPTAVPLVVQYSNNFLYFWSTRGISGETLRKTQTNEVMYWIPKQGANVPCSQFPIYYRGELIAYKYRAVLTKDFAISKDSDLAFYNADFIERAAKAREKIKYCVVVEGEIDLLSFIEAGVNCVISSPNGASNLSFLDKYMQNKTFDCVEQFILATDNDAAGIKFRDEFARRVGKSRCKIMQYKAHPTEGRECKDPNELLLAYGAGVLSLSGLTLRECPIDGVHYVEDVADKLEAIRTHGYAPYFKTGLHDLDKTFTWALSSQLTVISAAPNSAKTDFILNIAVRLALLHGAKIGIMSPETGEASDIYAALARIYMGKHFTGKPIGVARDSRIEISSDTEAAAALVFIKTHFFVYSCEDENISTADFLRIGQDLVAAHGVNMLICDPYNFLSDAFTPKKGDVEGMMSNYLNDNLQKIKFFASSSDVHVVLIPHPKQMQPYELMADFGQVNGGAAWGNKADNVMFLNRLYSSALERYSEVIRERGAKSDEDINNPDLGDHVEVVVRKVKKSYAGRRSEIRLSYELTTGRFGNALKNVASTFCDNTTLVSNYKRQSLIEDGDDLSGVDLHLEAIKNFGQH